MAVITLNALEGLTMDETYVVTVFVVLAELCDTFLAKPKYHPKMVPAEIMLVAVVAARYFNNNLERALLLLAQTGYIPPARRLSISRFNRQLHRYADFLDFRLLLLLILILPMGFITLLLATRAWRDQQRVNAARGWQSVPGKVIAASVESVSLPVRVQTSTSSYRMAVRYAPALVYEYLVNGRAYQGNRLRLGPRVLSSDSSSAERETARYPIGGQVTVWYDPANPADSTLETGIGRAVWTEWLVSGIMLMLTVAMAFLIFS